ncbi:MAG: hypothetical protein LBK56_14175 [Gracilibacteraceae bacterium]|jgi:hypothetical protein|nr:hypothetical protein [Gracilibacteraceae bacterium]
MAIQRNKSKNRIVVLTTLALVAVLFLGPGCATQAATDDPNMTAYDNQFSFTADVSDVSSSSYTEYLGALPADASYVATGYTNTGDAIPPNTVWSIASASGGLSADGVLTFGTAEGVNDGSVIYSEQPVTISEGATPGVASILATNTQASGSPGVNITLILDDEDNYDSSGTTVSNIVFQVFEPTTDGTPSSAGVVTLHSGTLPSVSADLNTDSHAYVTAYDAVQEAQALSVVTSATITSTDTGPYLQTLAVNGHTYTATGNYTDPGWLYQVYELSGSDYVTVELSELVGAGDFPLSDGQLIQWRFGLYGEVEFPETFPNPNIF